MEIRIDDRCNKRRGHDVDIVGDLDKGDTQGTRLKQGRFQDLAKYARAQACRLAANHEKVVNSIEQ